MTEAAEHLEAPTEESECLVLPTWVREARHRRLARHVTYASPSDNTYTVGTLPLDDVQWSSIGHSGERKLTRDGKRVIVRAIGTISTASFLLNNAIMPTFYLELEFIRPADVHSLNAIRAFAMDGDKEDDSYLSGDQFTCSKKLRHAGQGETAWRSPVSDSAI
ncbi:hypothetical protein C8Q76DRAFT_694498 [Earliella scabrosa]|nr:hypothetical protein C8Q76DRAFT_694498 [Earliella scabrosa]